MPTTYATNTKLTFKFGQRMIVGSTHQGVAEGTRENRVIVTTLTE